MEINLIVELVKFTKFNFSNIFCIGGGVYLTIHPRKYIEIFDAICLGEGEKILLEVLNRLEKKESLSGIPNLMLLNSLSKDKSNFCENINELPFPNRKIWHKWTKNVEFQFCCLYIISMFFSINKIRIHGRQTGVLARYMYDYCLKCNK
jgi:radical SAM superfamily enzyme YgiQ (UPF0313 family)